MAHFVKANLRQNGVTRASQKIAFNLVKELFQDINKYVNGAIKNIYSEKDDYRDIHIITLSEIYLVAAEAYLKAGNEQSALARLNEVRRRAGLAAAAAIDIDAILKERVCELFGQGSRWFDLRRTKKLVEYNNLYNKRLEGRAQQAIGQKLLRPIPQAAIDANDQMSSADQNPGY